VGGAKLETTWPDIEADIKGVEISNLVAKKLLTTEVGFGNEIKFPLSAIIAVVEGGVELKVEVS
jgi:hypothetical protein